jgi:hypothetical protein
MERLGIFAARFAAVVIVATRKLRNAVGLVGVALMFVGCGGKSNATGDVIAMDKICSYEKWKTVAVEGYLAPLSMVCEKASRKKTSGIAWCFFRVYGNSALTGPYISIQIPTTDSLSARNNRMESPTDRPEDLRIYDNDGNAIPAGNKIRVFGELPKSERCEFGFAKRIDRIP